jgi:hypothetical protein
MPSYLIYLPGGRGADPAHMDAAGLAGLTGDNCHAWESADVIERGPDGGSGTVWRFVDAKQPGRSPRLGNFPDRQTWTPQKVVAGQTPRWWLGRENGSRIEPADLARPKQHEGTFVTLADGQPWLIPLARQCPHINGRGPDGSFVRRVREEYRAYYGAAEGWLKRFMDSWIANKGARIDWAQEEVWPFTCQALAMHYHLTPELIDLLELVEDETHYAVVNAATELEHFIEALLALEKKTDSPPVAT